MKLSAIFVPQDRIRSPSDIIVMRTYDMGKFLRSFKLEPGYAVRMYRKYGSVAIYRSEGQGTAIYVISQDPLTMLLNEFTEERFGKFHD